MAVRAIDSSIVLAVPAEGLPLASSGESKVIDFGGSTCGGIQVYWDTLAFGAGVFTLWASIKDDPNLYDVVEDTAQTADDTKLTVTWDIARIGLRHYKVVYTAPGGSPAGNWFVVACGKGDDA